MVFRREDLPVKNRGFKTMFFYRYFDKALKDLDRPFSSVSSNNVAPCPLSTANGSIDKETFLLHRGRALNDNFRNISFDGLENLNSEDRELLGHVSRQVDNPTRIRTMNWPNRLTSYFVRKQFNMQ